MYIYDWIEFHNELWVYLNGMISIFLNVTHLKDWFFSVVRKMMGLE